MTPGAHLATAIEVLDQVLAGEPAGLTLTNWGRRNRFAGSRDRAAIRDIVFDCLRRRQSLSHQMGGALSGRALVLAYAASAGDDLDSMFSGGKYHAAPVTDAEAAQLADAADAPDHVRLNYPKFLDAELRRSLGEKFVPVMAAMTARAPVDLRVNRGRGRMPVAVAALKAEDIAVVPVPGVDTALRVTENQRRIGNSLAYREGLVELQDASSQAVTLMADAAPGMKVLDYCAGGGGKALALYDAIRGNGQVVAHDIAPVRMNDLPKRAARAGARITIAGPGHKAMVKGGFDLVFVDAPCTGTGSWRRTPDAKWRLTQADVDRATATQAAVLEQAAQYVRPGGTLFYATCSILQVENSDQTAAFLENDPGFQLKNQRVFTPLDCGDGFFGAKLVKV